MTILFISNDPNIFLENTASRERMRVYAQVLEREGGTLHILSRGKCTEEIEEGALHLHSIKTSKLFSFWVLSRKARALIKKYKVEVVSAQDPFEHGWAALRAARGTSAKLHLQVHTDFLSPWFTRGSIFRSPKVAMPLLNRFRILLAHHTLPRADGIRAVSHRVKDSMISLYGARIVVPSVLPIAVGREVQEKVAFPAHPFTFSLIAVGRLEPEKRIEDILAAIARIAGAYPSLGLFIVGEGRERARLQKMVQELGLQRRVQFLGNRPDARGLMQSAQAFIQASAYEGYGMTLIEAALAGVPIITSDVGIVGEVFVGYEHVLSAPVADPTNLAAHIAWLIEDMHARSALVLSAKARANEHLNEHDDLVTEVLADMVRLVQKIPV